jgi:acyl transferase domain-containing protein/acyl carrier protein
MSNQDLDFAETDIAIIGMAARFPGANNIDEYWENLKNSIESYKEYTEEELIANGVPESLVRNPNYVKLGRPLDNMEMFDAAFFGFSPKDASIMDPQHRHFLEVSWEALEHAGYDAEQYEGSIGMFGGSGHNAYMPYNLFSNPELMQQVGFFLVRHTANDKDFLTTRASYCMNLRGPSVNVQTACSTSLVAMHMAAQSLLNGECDMALAGGSTIEMPHHQGYLYTNGEILSPDGHCRAFDVKSAGTIFGSGVGQIVLKRMEDAINDGDTIHAVIKGSAINNDGSSKIGYLAPSVDGQAAAITEALEISEVDAESISYIETHGTGTPVGDPIEVTALTQAFETATDKKGFCALGSVKTNIGHLDTAAGVAGVIKIAQAMKNELLPASLHFEEANPAFEFENTPFYVNAKPTPWKVNGTPLRAAINSLGVGGTNAHAILEQAPIFPPSDNHHNELICLSARTQTALDQVTHRLHDYLQANPQVSLADAAHTLRAGRKAQAVRMVLTASSMKDAIHALSGDDVKRMLTHKSTDKKQSLYFMFTGQGAQYVNMCKHLYQNEIVFKNALESCATKCQTHVGLNILDIIYPDKNGVDKAQELISQTQYTQPILFSIEYAMSKQLEHWGIQADAMIGHSIGEYVAACISGVFSLDDALKLVAARGRLMQSLPEGSMLVVPMDEKDVSDLLQQDIAKNIDIAAVNAPGLCVVSGPDSALEKFQQHLTEKDIETTKLHTSHAFHSAMMDPILNDFKALFSDIKFGEITTPFISNSSGDWIESSEAQSAEYWANHLRNPVYFARGLQRLLQTEDAVLVECGPGQTLTTFARINTDKTKQHVLVQSIPHAKQNLCSHQSALLALGQCWSAGIVKDWSAFHKDYNGRRIPLPTYPFEHQRCWIEPGNEAYNATGQDKNLSKLPFNEWFWLPGWESQNCQPVTDKAELLKSRVLFIHNEHSFNQQCLKFYKQLLGESSVIEARLGTEFSQTNSQNFTFDAGNSQQCQQLFKALKQNSFEPSHIIHGLNIGSNGNESDLYKGFDQLLVLGQFLSSHGTDNTTYLSVLTNGMQQLGNEKLSAPLKASLLGPVKTITQEIPTVFCSSYDIDIDHINEWELKDCVQQLSLDCLLNQSDEEIAYRGTNRFIRHYSALDYNTLPELDNISDNENKIKKGGTYLITGGIGGIGETLSRHLHEKYQANIILLNRSALPAQQEWQNYIAQNNDTIAQRLKTITALQTDGANIFCFNGDITKLDTLQQAVDNILKDSNINGIFHTAGIVNDNLLALKDIDDSHNVLAPKIEGLLNLDKALGNHKPDFICLFSSTSAILGVSGQVDYTAGNAFMDAYARYKRQHDGTRVVSVNWGAWADVGMAVAFARSRGIGSREDLKHYFYTSKESRNGIDQTFAVTVSAKTHWIIDQHRAKNNTALVPGTAYLEIARSAFDIQDKYDAVELRDVFFMLPFTIEGDESKELQTHLTPSKDGMDFTIQSEFDEENVKGSIHKIETPPPAPLNIGAIIERCNKSFEDRKGIAEHHHLLFGDRWKCLNSVHFGKKEVLVTVEVDDVYLNELDNYKLHPAVLDMATGAGQTLNHDYNPEKDLYIPISYSRIRVYGPMQKNMFSHILYSADDGQGSQTSIFNIQICDNEGNILIDIENFVMKRIDASVLSGLKSVRPADGSLTNQPSPSDQFFELTMNNGFSSDEGMRALDFAINRLRQPQLVVSPLKFDDYCQIAKNLRNVDEIDDDEDFEGLDRPSLSSDYIPPESKLQKDIALIWMKALGINDIGIADDFFELGGHSLLLTQIVSRLKKKLAMELPMTELFESPTIADWANVLESNEHSGEALLPQIEIQAREKYKRRTADIFDAA